MKKIGVFLSILLLGSVVFPRDTIKIGAYVGYFSPADQTLKEIYDGEDFIYGIKMGIRVWKEFYIWLSGRQFKKTSETTLLGDITTLTLQPINLSLRYTFNLGSVNPYLEGGYTYIFFNEESDIGDVKGEGKGYCVDVGIEFKLSFRVIIDIGARYSRAAVRPTGFDVQLGGAQAGISFLVVF
ncbi:MAG: outer membrane beta-barrel protein [Candidatus Aminicenantes bacterium]|nr:MAG: outer membrane beta-barrel protein [Candidatus Aminicenantes bacterium]